MTRAKILIVEDEGIVALDIETSLKDLGYDVVGIAYSGEDAIIQARAKRPDLILMDIYLRGEKDGIQASEVIYQTMNIPVVYLTAYSDPDTLERAKITQPFGYIIKPYKERELHVVIETSLHKHKIENDLKETQKWLSTTLDSIGDAVITTDSQGAVKYLNPIAESLTGWSQSEAAGRQINEVFNIVNEETGREVEDMVQRVLREGIVVGMANHTVLISKNGERRVIDNSCAPIKDALGNVLGVVLAFNDIARRRWLQEIVLKAREDYQIIFDSVPTMILYVNRAQKIIRANDAMAKFIGIAVKDLVGKNIRALFSEESQDFYKGNDKVIESGISQYGMVSKYKVGKGEYKWALINKFPYMDKKGNVEGVILVIEDITESKTAEDKLKTQERNFRAIAENAYDGIFITDKKGKLVFANQRAEKITELSNAKLLTSNIDDLVKVVESEGKKSLRKYKLPLRIEAILKNSSEKGVFLDVTAVNTTWHDQAAILYFLRDISEGKYAETALKQAYEELELKMRKRTAGISTAIEVLNKEIKKRIQVEKNLRLSEERFRTQYMNIPLPTVTWEKSDGDFILVDYNEAAAKISEGRMTDFVGAKSSDFISEPNDFTDDLEQCFREKTSLEREGLYGLKETGESKQLAMKLAFVPPKFVMVHAEDISERKMAENAVRESEERYRMLIENLRDGIAILDTSSVFAFCNPAAEKILGIEKGKLIMKNFSEFVDSKTYRLLKRKVDLCAKGESSYIELDITRPGGEERNLEMNLMPLTDNDGDYIGAFIVFRDETDRKRAMEEKQHYFQARLEAEKKLYETNQLAERSARLASIGVLAAGITHEINQPLNAVMMNIEHLLFWDEQNKGALPDLCINLLNDISTGARNIDKIIKHMRSFWVTPVSDQIMEVDLNGAVQNAMLLVNRQMQQHGIKSHFELCEEYVNIHGNKVQLELILVNLVSNSIYSLDSVDIKEKYIKVKTYREEGRAYLEVEDNGVGLPEGVEEELFDPFFSTKKPGEGMGLGLAIVKMFINRFEGKINAFNNETGGASFKISFPIIVPNQGESEDGNSSG